jgi:hypothetical protein
VQTAKGEQTMPDMEKVISDIEQQIRWIEEIECHKFPGWMNVTNAMRDALAILKEQEEREQRICKSICNFIRGACSTDTDDDKDFVCYEIQNCFTEGR